MSMIETTTARYGTALAAISVHKDSGLLQLTEDDLKFLMGEKAWIATDRSRARFCIEAAVYGATDYFGFSRIAVPAEFIAGTIAYFVHPTNLLTACSVMEGAEWSENIIQGVERPVSGQVLFAHTLRVRAGIDEDMEARLTHVKQRIKQGLI